jgi:hypothetical protein
MLLGVERRAKKREARSLAPAEQEHGLGGAQKEPIFGSQQRQLVTKPNAEPTRDIMRDDGSRTRGIAGLLTLP